MVTSKSGKGGKSDTFDFNTRFDMNACDLFDNLTWWMQVDQPFVNSHLVTIPGFRTLTVGRFPSRDFEDFGGQSHGSLDFEIFVLGACNQIRTD